MLPTPDGPDQAPSVTPIAWRVRAAQWRDWPALSALLRRLCPEVGDAELSHRLRNELHRYAVALGPHGLAGFVRLDVQPGRRVTRIDGLAVDPAMRGRGVAQALLAHADEAACACATDRLEVVLGDMDEARMRYCLRHGFVAVAAPAQATGLCLARNVAPQAWPRWELRSCHAPRVPPAVLQRAISRAVYHAWVRPPAPPAQGQRRWEAVSRPAAASTADA